MAKPTRAVPSDHDAASSGGRSRKSRKPRSRRRIWAGRIIKTLAIVVALGVVAGLGTVVVAYQRTDLPDPHADFETNTTFIYYRDGETKIGSFAIQNRQSISYEEMPQNIKDAVVAAENRSFWEDPGFSIRGLVRSAWVILQGGDLQGGSTITQQYIKTKYLTPEQTPTRKFKELLLATKLSRSTSKEDILEGYLNTIYFGRGAYGIQAASKAYFNVDAAKLTVPQAAVLASVINNPSIFDPSVDKDNVPRLLDRYRYVLSGMAETGKITTSEEAKYAKALPKFPDVPVNSRYGGPKGFLMKLVEDELVSEGFTPAEINGGGLQVVTTFDKDSQDAAVKAAQHYTKVSAKAADEPAKDLHVAIASVDVGTGEVRALYGGPDFVENSRNWATTPRATASTFKTFALAAALSDEYSLFSIFNGNTFRPPGSTTNVRNEFSNQYGPVNLIKATADSINTAFVDLTYKMADGAKKISAMAQKVGAVNRTKQVWEDNPRLALGDGEVSPLDQAGAYATFANGGTRVDNHVVREVKDINGKTLYKAKPKEDRAVTTDVASDVTYALSSVVEEGTGTSVQTLDRPVAGKTGTQGVGDEIKSAWFVAYTKQISTAVMYVAGDDGNHDLDPYRRPGDQTFFGGTYPALTWVDYMKTATQGQKVEQFPDPAYVNRDKAPSPRPVHSSTRPPQSSKSPTASETPSATDAPTQPSDTPTQPTTPPPSDPATQPTEPTEPPSTKPPTTQTTQPTKPPTTQPTQPTKPPTTKATQPTKPPATAPSQGGDAGDDQAEDKPNVGAGSKDGDTDRAGDRAGTLGREAGTS